MNVVGNDMGWNYTGAKNLFGWILPVVKALEGNPYDGHTLNATVDQVIALTGVEPERTYVDRGYRGHDADKSRVFLSGQKRGVTPTIRREIRRRAGIEPVIGHMKEDGHLGRNFLAGATGDAINVILAAAGHNLRLLRAWLIRLLASLLSILAISRPMQLMSAPQLTAHRNRVLHGRLAARRP